jgi:hypothetical protein
LTVRAGRPEGWNDGKGKDDGVTILSGAVGVMFFEVFAGFDDAGGQAKETRRRRGATSSSTGCLGGAGGWPRFGGTAAGVLSGVWQAFKRCVEKFEKMQAPLQNQEGTCVERRQRRLNRVLAN